MTTTTTDTQAPAGTATTAATAPQAAPHWFDSLPPELQGDKTIAGYKGKDVSELAKSLVGAQKLIGVDKIQKPQEGWSQADWDAFYDASGRPKDITGYAVPEKLPEGIQLDEAMTKAFFEKARAEGLNKRQAAAVIAHYADMQSQAQASYYEQQQESIKAASAELDRRFGPAKNERMGLAKEALKFAASEEDRTAILSNPLIANNPAIIELLANVGKAVATDQIIGRGTSYKPVATPPEALAKIAALRADPSFAKRYYDSSHPEHAFLVKELDELYAIAHGKS